MSISSNHEKEARLINALTARTDADAMRWEEVYKGQRQGDECTEYPAGADSIPVKTTIRLTSSGGVPILQVSQGAKAITRVVGGNPLSGLRTAVAKQRGRQRAEQCKESAVVLDALLQKMEEPQ